MTTEDMVRRALREEAAALVPSPWPAVLIRGAVRARARRRRARRTALAVALAMAVPVGVVGVGALASGPGAVRVVSGGVPTAPASSPASSDPTSSMHPGSSVRIVTDGQKVLIGRGRWVRLTAAETCVGGVGDSEQCSATADGNQSPDSISLRILGDSTGTFFLPLYVGSGQAARITVTVAGRTYQAAVLTLSGHPGYATGYVWVPGQESASVHETTTVYDTGGAVLATFGSE